MKVFLIYLIFVTTIFSQTSWDRKTIIDEDDEQAKRRSKIGFFLSADILAPTILTPRRLSFGYSISSSFKLGITFHSQREWFDSASINYPGVNSYGIFYGNYDSTVKVSNYQSKIPYMGETLFLEIFPFKKTMFNNFYIPLHLGRIQPSLLINNANFYLVNPFTHNSNSIIANIRVNENASLYYGIGLGYRIFFSEGFYLGLETDVFKFPNRSFNYNIQIISDPKTNPINLLDYYLYSKQAKEIFSYPNRVTIDLRIIIGKVF